MNYYKSGSTIKPKKVDMDSSKTTVYLRRNIMEKECEMNGNIFPYYEYEEAKLTKDEYEKYVAELSSEKIQAAIEELKAKADSLDNISEQLELLTECILEISKLIYE